MKDVKYEKISNQFILMSFIKKLIQNIKYIDIEIVLVLARLN